MSAPVIKPHKVEKHDGGASTSHYRVTTMAQAMVLFKRASSYRAHVTMPAYLHSTDENYRPTYYRACAELGKSAMERFIEDAIGFAKDGDDEYISVRLYRYTLPPRYNRRTMKEGKPRPRVTFYIG